MSLILVEPGKSEFELIPEDTYSSVCYAIVDNGEAYDEKWGKVKRKVTFMWELEFENKAGQEKRSSISKTYVFSMHENASLRKMLKAWRGREFTAEELKGFDLENVLGAPCLLQITHYTTADGNVRAGINTISKLPKSMAKLEPERALLYFDCEESDLELLDTLPAYLQERIKESITYKNRVQCESAGATEELDDSDEDDLPF